MILQECSIWKVLEIFFIEPTSPHYIKEISRKINLAHTSVKRHILELAKLGLIQESQQIFKAYKSSRENPEFIFAKKIGNIIFLKESGLIENLKEHYPKSIILFGSYSKGEDTESSDIDLFVDSKKLKINLEKYEKVLKRKIHLLFREEVSKSLIESINQGEILYGER